MTAREINVILLVSLENINNTINNAKEGIM
jgi:hypothetical protein